MTRLFRLATRGALVLLAGCNSCASEYTIPDGFEPSSAPTPEDHGAWLSMDVTPDGERLAVSFYDRTKGALGFAVGSIDATTDTVSWNYEQIAGYADSDGVDQGDVGKFTSMQVAADGSVWVAYQDIDEGYLYVAHRVGYTWNTWLADTGTESNSRVGEWSNLAIDASGTPVIVHHDAGAGTLLRTTLTNGDITEGQWVTEEIWAGEDSSTINDDGVTVVTPASVGMFARLMIVDNTEFIAFYDAAQHTLNLLEGALGGYVHTVVTPTSVLLDHDSIDMGQWPSMLIEGTTLHIAFQDVTNQDLVLASREGGANWTYTGLDTGDNRGADTEIFKYRGELSVLYFDGFENNMMVADRSSGDWISSRLGGELSALGFHNEAAKVGETMWVASYDYTHRNIFVRPLD